MGIDHGRTEVPVPEQLLDGSYVGAGLKEVGRERVPERVAGGVLGDARLAHGAFHVALEGGRVPVMAPLPPARRVDIGA